MKLKFDTITLNQFNSFKIVPKKRKTNADKILTTKLVRGICFKEGDNYKIRIDTKVLNPDIVDKGNPDFLVLDFTEESYNIKGVISVFDKIPNKFGKYVRYIRNELKAKFFPGSQEKYVPFCPNWICNGHIIKRDGVMLFNFNECILPEGYKAFIPEDDE